MKMPIEWHKNNNVNRLKYIESRKKELHLLESDIELAEQEWELSAQQIERAEKEGIKEFDSEKFNKKRGNK